MKKDSSNRFSLVLLMLCSLSVLGPATATAQSYADLVWDQLKAVYGVASDDGYDSMNYIVGKIDEGETEAWTLTLVGGYSYMILGACDGDCQDIDIRLYDEDGNLVDSDTTEDDVPAVQGTVDTTARFTVEVEMYACSSEPCYFGFGVFYK